MLTDTGTAVAAEYWNNFPPEHCETLFSMREEDFVAELDAHMKYRLKICKDCRGNVMRGKLPVAVGCGVCNFDMHGKHIRHMPLVHSVGAARLWLQSHHSALQGSVAASLPALSTKSIQCTAPSACRRQTIQGFVCGFVSIWAVTLP